MIAVHSREREKSVNSALCCHKPASVQPEYKTAWAHFSTEESQKQPSHGFYLFKKGATKPNIVISGQSAAVSRPSLPRLGRGKSGKTIQAMS